MFKFTNCLYKFGCFPVRRRSRVGAEPDGGPRNRSRSATSPAQWRSSDDSRRESGVLKDDHVGSERRVSIRRCSGRRVRPRRKRRGIQSARTANYRDCGKNARPALANGTCTGQAIGGGFGRDQPPQYRVLYHSNHSRAAGNRTDAGCGSDQQLIHDYRLRAGSDDGSRHAPHARRPSGELVL